MGLTALRRARSPRSKSSNNGDTHDDSKHRDRCRRVAKGQQDSKTTDEDGEKCQTPPQGYSEAGPGPSTSGHEKTGQQSNADGGSEHGHPAHDDKQDSCEHGHGADQARELRKYSIVRVSPAARGIVGSQPRSSLARVMSGCRRIGSS